MDSTSIDIIRQADEHPGIMMFTLAILILIGLAINFFYKRFYKPTSESRDKNDQMKDSLIDDMFDVIVQRMTQIDHNLGKINIQLGISNANQENFKNELKKYEVYLEKINDKIDKKANKTDMELIKEMADTLSREIMELKAKIDYIEKSK